MSRPDNPTPTQKAYWERAVDRRQTVMRVLRERAGLSQTELARMLQRKQPEVSMWEHLREPMSLPMRIMTVGILRSILKNEYPHLSEANLLRPWDEMFLLWSQDATDGETKSADGR